MPDVLKVGIITMHRVVNYGSFLQAYATQRTVEQLGYEAELIDYAFPNDWHRAHGAPARSLKARLIEWLGFLGITPRQRMRKAIAAAGRRYYRLSRHYGSPAAIYRDPPRYDIYLTGSDQTWNPRHMRGDPVFLLGFAPPDARRIAFSASFACTDVGSAHRATYADLLSRYSHIAVREANGIALVRDLASKDAVVTLDPTLLLGREEWAVLANRETAVGPAEEYILLYMLSYAFDPQPYIYQLLAALQQRSGRKVLSFTRVPPEFGIDYTFVGGVGVERYLQLFMRAACVVTSSFHGTAFAVNFGIPLCSVIKATDAPDDRQLSLLRQLGAASCAVPVGTDPAQVAPDYDVAAVQTELARLRAASIEYLKRALAGDSGQ